MEGKGKNKKTLLVNQCLVDQRFLSEHQTEFTSSDSTKPQGTLKGSWTTSNIEASNPVLSLLISETGLSDKQIQVNCCLPTGESLPYSGTNLARTLDITRSLRDRLASPSGNLNT